MTAYGIGEFRMRNGGKAVVEHDDGGNWLPLKGTIDGGVTRLWHRNGRYIFDEHEYDLVAPWEEPAPDHIETEMKPCPFCGCPRILTMPPTCDKGDTYDPTDRAMPVARCLECFSETLGENWDATCDSAIAAWNRRWSDTVDPAPDPIDTEMQAWLAGVEAGFEGVTPGDWTARNHNQQEQLGGYNDKYVAIDVDGNTHRSLVEDLIAPDADHIARTNPKRMAALIGWLKSKGVMK